jgi:hypothetical protein
MGGWAVRIAIVMTALAASIAPAASASAKQVPCTKLSYGKYQCSFYPPGDGISGGAPVQNATGKTVGYLNQGHNWIVCQASGATVHYHGYHNRWWGYTEANDHQMGWVNAVYASGGSNNGPFAKRVPNCGSTYGSPPASTAPSPKPTPTPAPSPSPTPAPPPKPVPCTNRGGGHHTCTFYKAGNGHSGGAPVRNASGHVVGYLHKGRNWVVCQQQGQRVTHGRYYNNNWAWTLADDGKWGWVNALWASGGDNDGAFGGTPACYGAHGNPPGVSYPVQPPPNPKPKPKPKPKRHHKPKPGTTLPTPVNMGSYGTYHFREELFRNKSGKRRAPNFNDWTPKQMMTQLNRNFSHYFTFTGCGKHLYLGEKCTLDTTLAPDAPVQVIAIAPDGFALRSRGGHPEGAGRTITFEFQTYVNEAEISTMSLEVEAWGPLGGTSLLGPLNSNTIAKTSWGIFSDNITNRYPDVPPGGFVPPGGGVVV